MSKRALIPILIIGGLATGLGLSTLVALHGDANAQPMTFDAAPTAAPLDASIVEAPAGSSLPALPDPSDDGGGFVLSSYKWILAGGWLALVPFLVGLIWIARHPKTWPLSKVKAFQTFVATARGAAVLTLAMTLSGMLLHAILATGGAPSLAAIKVAVMTGASAAGLYSLLKAIVYN